MAWTEENRARLLACTSDQEIRETFPTHKLENLKRRQREFRKDMGMPSNSEALGKLAELLDKADIPIDEIKSVKKVRLNEWQMAHKDENGEAVITDLKSAQIVIEPKWNDGPEWPVVQQAAPTVISPAKIRARDMSEFGTKVAVILPDPQIGYRRDILREEYDPFHDEKAMDLAMQIVTELQPDVIVNLGDLVDLPEFSRHPQEPGFARTTQRSIDRAHNWLAQQRASSPEAEIVLLEGNHDRRLEKAIVLNAQSAFGLQRANVPESWPVLSLPFLLRMDELNIQYLEGYPANIYWINDSLACIHGHKTRSGGSTAAAVVGDERSSIIFGHIHRIEMQHQTRRVRSGSRTNLAACPGCLCRVDGAVPGFKASTDIYGRSVQSWENWQQGIAVVYYEEGEGFFHVELVPIHDGTCIFRGKTYAASDLTQ